MVKKIACSWIIGSVLFSLDGFAQRRGPSGLLTKTFSLQYYILKKNVEIMHKLAKLSEPWKEDVSE